jgi:transcriptional regulator with XRE-family HTH domain
MKMLYPFVDRSAVAENLRQAISASGMSAARVADLASVQPSHLSRFLKTGVGIDPTKVARIAAAVGVDVRTIYRVAA